MNFVVFLIVLEVVVCVVEIVSGIDRDSSSAEAANSSVCCFCCWGSMPARFMLILLRFIGNKDADGGLDGSTSPIRCSRSFT